MSATTAVIETTNPSPSFWRKWWSAWGSRSAFNPVVALFLAKNVTPDITFEATVALSPQQAYDRIKAGLLAVCRTRVVATYPTPISAACYYGDFDGGLTSATPALGLAFTIRTDADQRTIIRAVSPADGNTDIWAHELKRSEIRRLMEWIVG